MAADLRGPPTEVRATGFDVHLFQAIVAHDDLVDRERVEELVREDDALDAVRERVGRRERPIEDPAERLALRGARRGTRLNER